MDVCIMYVYAVCVVFCGGRDLATG
jgi:hypothetical protein